MKYNYIESMKQDVRQYMEDNESYLNYTDREDLEQQLNDDCWTADRVTGNASGSYTFNCAEAKKYVLDNIDLLKDAYEEFGLKEQFTEDFFSENWERMDVTIRCFLLGQVIADVLEKTTRRRKKSKN